MGYEDFCVFFMASEDKTTPQALRYWFNVCDIDGDGEPDKDPELDGVTGAVVGTADAEPLTHSDALVEPVIAQAKARETAAVIHGR